MASKYGNMPNFPKFVPPKPSSKSLLPNKVCAVVHFKPIITQIVRNSFYNNYTLL